MQNFRKIIWPVFAKNCLLTYWHTKILTCWQKLFHRQFPFKGGSPKIYTYWCIKEDVTSSSMNNYQKRCEMIIIRKSFKYYYNFLDKNSPMPQVLASTLSTDIAAEYWKMLIKMRTLAKIIIIKKFWKLEVYLNAIEVVVWRCVLWKISSNKFRKIHTKTTVPESLFFWRCRPEASNFIKKETLPLMFSC